MTGFPPPTKEVKNSVCPGYIYPAELNASLWIGPVTIASVNFDLISSTPT